MTTTNCSFVGNLKRIINEREIKFTFAIDQKDPRKGVFIFDSADRELMGEYTRNSTVFATDVYGLYMLAKSWLYILQGRNSAENLQSDVWTQFKTSHVHGSDWESLEFANTNLRPSEFAFNQSWNNNSTCYDWSAESFTHHFHNTRDILNTCISWGTDRDGAIEVLDEIYNSGILIGFCPMTRVESSFRTNLAIRDYLENLLLDFFRPVDLRLTEDEFRALPRRVMGRPLMRELELSECPDCPICMEQIRSRQHCTVLPCKHLMHVNCARQWLMEHCTKPTCPLCRCNCRHETAEHSRDHPRQDTEETPDTRPATPIMTPESDYDSMPELLDEEIEYESYINSITESDSPNNIISVFGQEITPINNSNISQIEPNQDRIPDIDNFDSILSNLSSEHQEVVRRIINDVEMIGDVLQLLTNND